MDGDDQGWPNSNTRRTHGAAQEQGYLGKCQGSEATADGDAQHRVASGVKQARRAQQAQQVQQARLSSRAGRLVEMRSDLTSHHHLTTRVLCRQSVRAGADAGTAPARDVAFGGRGQWIAVCPRAAIASSVGAETIVMKITDPGWISVPSRGTNRRPTDASTHHQLQLQLQLQPGSPSTSTPNGAHMSGALTPLLSTAGVQWGRSVVARSGAGGGARLLPCARASNCARAPKGRRLEIPTRRPECFEQSGRAGGAQVSGGWRRANVVSRQQPVARWLAHRHRCRHRHRHRRPGRRGC